MMNRFVHRSRIIAYANVFCDCLFSVGINLLASNFTMYLIFTFNNLNSSFFIKIKNILCLFMLLATSSTI